MRIAKIKNKYMYKGNKPNGWHWYLIFFNRKKKRYEAIQTTHLYEIPPKKLRRLKKGEMIEEKIFKKGFPSGVKGTIFVKNSVDGGNIDPKCSHFLYISKNHLSKDQSKRIKRFIERISKENPGIQSTGGKK